MRSFLKRHRLTAERRRSDEGVALVAAIAIMGLVTVMIVTMMTFALRENRSSGRDRQRDTAMTTAEGSVDLALARMTNAAPASMPCGTNTTTPTVGPDKLTVATTVTYYNASGSVLSCPLASSVTAAKAFVKSVATSSRLEGGFPARRIFESEVTMKATFASSTGGVYNKAVFGNTAITLANQANIYGYNNQPNADLYSNGDIVCQNNQSFHGTLISAGSITMSNSCTVDVDAYAKVNFVSQNPQSTVSGNVYAYNSATVNSGNIGGTLYAPAVSGNWCSGNSKCKQQTPPVAFPAQTFPVLNYVASDWANAGYTAVTPTGSYANCNISGSANGPGQWLIDNAATLTGPTVMLTSCQVVLQQNNGNIKLNNDLAIFATGGFSFNNNTQIDSTSTTARKFYLIQPYNAVSGACNTDGIVLNNQVTFTQYINDFLYSPCNVRKANNATHYGQIYAGGTAQIDNRLTMYYVPISVPGSSSDGSGAGVQSYAVDVTYQRENNS